ncbi:hypothetical protein [Paraburkholderia sp. J12]|uniref:hypothetical protein n=1 Tax=Paraburkholderia sp. J12 TaxID=2805432 RepID=UPI002ABE60FE|nr:hypothetical protein [Paraburkholderia sp. J12]
MTGLIDVAGVEQKGQRTIGRRKRERTHGTLQSRKPAKANGRRSGRSAEAIFELPAAESRCACHIGNAILVFL